MIWFIAVTVLFVVSVVMNVVVQTRLRRQGRSGEAVRRLLLTGRIVMIVSGVLFLVAAYSLVQNR